MADKGPGRIDWGRAERRTVSVEMKSRTKEQENEKKDC
jgi:hypothetical protein